MKENKYDNNEFFNKYSRMERSIGGLESAGEWHVLKNMLPKFEGKRVLDIGCGFGWHCRYAIDEKASSVLGIDISKKMLERAREYTKSEKIKYECIAMEDLKIKDEEFDIVISSLAFHYVKDFDEICKRVYKGLSNEGNFVFSVEHPIFTSNEKQDWIYDEDKEIICWPIDNYQDEEIRHTNFLGEKVTKYHRTVSTYINTLIENGFRIEKISEPEPPQAMMKKNPYLKNELRRPMFLMISAKKEL